MSFSSSLPSTTWVWCPAAVGWWKAIVRHAPSAFASAVATMTAQTWGLCRSGPGPSGLSDRRRCFLPFGPAHPPRDLDRPVFQRFRRHLRPRLYLRSTHRPYPVAFLCMNSYFHPAGPVAFFPGHSLAATFGVRIPASYLLSHGPATLFKSACRPWRPPSLWSSARPISVILLEARAPIDERAPA